MRRLKLSGVLLLAATSLWAATKQFTPATITDIQRKSTTRVLYYQVDTPITQEDPYFEIAVQLKDTVYFGRYTPMHSRDTLPEDWHAGAQVQARIDGRHLVLLRPGGTEMSFAFTKRPAKVTPGGSETAAPNK